MKKLVLILCLFAPAAMPAASPQRSALLQSQLKLRDVIQAKLDQENSLCARGQRERCQDALFNSVELNNINSEILLGKLRGSVRGEELRE